MWLTSFFPNMFLIPWHLRIFQTIHQHQHGDCRILADGTGIWHLECCYCLTSVLGRRPRPDHPRHSLRTCLHPLLLDFNQPHPMPVIWRSFIWTFCSCIKCILHPAVVLSRWRLREWFQQGLTNTFTKNTMHTPCIQYGTCILRSCPHYAMPPSWYPLLWHTAIPTRPVCHCLTFLSDSSESDQDPDSSSDDEEDFQIVPMMMNIGPQKWYQREHFAYIKMDYQTMYVNTYALIGIIITLSHIWTA